MNWRKVEQDRKMNYRPSPLAEPITQSQQDYILGLQHQKAHKVRMPKTKGRAGQLIEWLKGLPDVNEPRWYRNGKPAGESSLVENKPPSVRQEMIIDLRESFPELTPMTANSLVQLAASACEEFALALFVNEVIEDAEFAPAELPRLVEWLMRRFLAFSAA